MTQNNLGGLLEKRRSALVEYCIGKFGTADADYAFLKTPGDLFELLRMDPLDNYPVQSSWVAEATSCAQQFIHAAYRKLEPGYDKHSFDKNELKHWEVIGNYADWAAVTQITYYPENYINPFVRQRKTSLFKELENNLNQSRLNSDSVQIALQNYLQAFEQTCDLDVISSFFDGDSATRADYYFVGRQRMPPYQVFWRKAQIELSASCTAINPASWGEWRPIDVATGADVLDMRPVFWNGRLCLVWAEWQARVQGTDADKFIKARLTINLAFMTQNGQWSAPLCVHNSEREETALKDVRLIATVLIDGQHPKGRLGMLLTQSGAEAITIYEQRDVLMRLVQADTTWLKHLADCRFKNALVVQHPLIVASKPVVTAVTPPEIAGSLTGFYDLEVILLADDKDRFLVRGICKPSGLAAGTADFTLAFLAQTAPDPEPITKPLSPAGGWVTPWMLIERNPGTITQPFRFTLGADATYGRVEFSVATHMLRRFAAPALEKNTADAAQFIAFNQYGMLAHTRLNSLFGPELVQRAHVSVDAVLDWDTQFLSEPPPAGKSFEEPNGPFNGANGLYFWELFFHLPHLVATRLCAEDRYPEAQNWLHYVFDPRAPAVPSTPAKPCDRPRYWRCRPLTSNGNVGCETQTPLDPDAIGYAAPKHLQILMFNEYVKNLLAWGDWYYRQLTRDSLVAAKLCYVQAEFLMGKPPVARTVTRWETKTVRELLNTSRTRPALEEFEKQLDYSLADFPPAAETAPFMGMLANPPFKLPINEQLLQLFDLPGQRLRNLRNNLTLDGKPLNIALFSPPTDPNQLLRDLAAGGMGGARPMGGRAVVGAFHWRVTFDAAMRAVQTLQEYGNQVLHLLEQRDRAEQEEIQQDHLVELGNYAKIVQEYTVEELAANQKVLEQSLASVTARGVAYKAWYDEHISAVEYEVMDDLQLAKQLGVSSVAIKGAGGVLASLPNIFGFSNGGHRLEELANAVVYGLDIGSLVLQMNADKKAVEEGYRLRRRDWELLRDQADAEKLVIEEQLKAHAFALTAAEENQRYTERANVQSLAIYNYLKKRATNAELYGWLLGQLKALHYQAYDAVVSLCLSAQASLSAATGDYDAPTPLPQVWLDNRHGLTAGDHLREYLLRMERKHLQSFERRLERIKTVSLRQLFDDPNAQQIGFASWSEALAKLVDSGTLEFRLTQMLFDRDHPGEYCRLISSVEVDLPVLTGPYEDVRATLQQIGSTIATQPSAESVRYLHRAGTGVAPADVQFNLRSGQEIGVSTGFADNGMVSMKAEDGLLDPFEHTGAVSRWQLNFPWPKKQPQAAMLASMTDIIVRIRYSAKVGQPGFRLAVESLVNDSEQSSISAAIKGAGNHA